jgi:hypothetical protein
VRTRQTAFAQARPHIRTIVRTGQIGAPVFSGFGFESLMAYKPQPHHEACPSSWPTVARLHLRRRRILDAAFWLSFVTVALDMAVLAVVRRSPSRTSGRGLDKLIAEGPGGSDLGPPPTTSGPRCPWATRASRRAVRKAPGRQRRSIPVRGLRGGPASVAPLGDRRTGWRARCGCVSPRDCRAARSGLRSAPAR